ncbi:type I 3-dehydroquinate dehydratase [Mediterraneibacter agrestimuris]|uniref:type I 3-dehydroquinate dehydratase n=1 Tax=Mediterraneibacter agrestimuris TaxID=2941333 RepID=UPI00203B4D88|nr:type I 3-dehydroquinate dehydratase [Mediterraneibacter agrestimuris]
MNPVVIRGVAIGEGIPKICAPIVGRTEEEILKEAGAMHELPVDVVEWRADWYESVFEPERVLGILCGLRKILGELPLLFTFRTLKEGGEKEINTERYAELNRLAAESGYVDLIDVEAFTGEEVVRGLVETAHACSVKVIGSNHDFHGTPLREEIVNRLQNMQGLGVDIPKIAVMPKDKQDVLTLLSATEEMSRLYADRPIITMSMAGDGVISRICGEAFGSALTFGAAGQLSAPGQLGVKELRQVLEILHI